MKGMVHILALLFTTLACVGWDNLDYGVPGTNGVVVLEQEGYACGFDTNKQQAAWVSYRLTLDEVEPSNRVVRVNCFMADARLGEGSVTPEDYRGSGYDRGHLAPAGDMMWSESAMRDSFLMSNMSPQRPEFNRGIWRELECWVRECARTNGSVVVVTGPVFGDGEGEGGEKRSRGRVDDLMSGSEAAGMPPLLRIGRHGVVVPEGYYKVLLLEGERTTSVRQQGRTTSVRQQGVTASVRQQEVVVTNAAVIGFMLPNRGSTNSVESFRVPVSAVEAATGLEFFRAAPASFGRKGCPGRMW